MITEDIKLIQAVNFPDIEFPETEVYFDYHGVKLYKSPDITQLAKNLSSIAFPGHTVQVLNARLHDMPAGCMLKEHTDRVPPDAEHFHVLHFPLKTNPDAFLAFGDTHYHMQKHTLYEFNYSRPHWGGNAGTENRIHLFMEIYAYENEEV